ncbi:hypothetical protein SAMN05444959_11748 [Paracoccus seriniphilus]|uniref:Uncharacterized protein n=1 Tax=Paracoccus seriniphilus TaxID=184748 RepID=A0A239Q0Z4_9RHOB|nr:hypothetical protein SAMN05444959_11748 [Paracoccus seriniphilus]
MSRQRNNSRSISSPRDGRVNWLGRRPLLRNSPLGGCVRLAGDGAAANVHASRPEPGMCQRYSPACRAFRDARARRADRSPGGECCAALIARWHSGHRLTSERTMTLDGRLAFPIHDTAIRGPASGMSRSHLKGLKQIHTRSHVQKVKKVLHRRGQPNMRLGASQPGATLERRMPPNRSAHAAIIRSNRGRAS